MTPLPLILYSTDFCTLCDQALDLLLTLPQISGSGLTVIDVAGDVELEARYGEHLPVLAIGTVELKWPFTAAAILDGLAQAARN